MSEQGKAHGRLVALLIVLLVIFFIFIIIAVPYFIGQQTGDNAASVPVVTATPLFTLPPSPKNTVKPTPIPTPRPTPTPRPDQMTKDELAAYKGTFITIPYKTLARDPDKYTSQLITFSGRVVQVMEDGNELTLRIATSEDEWDDIFLVGYVLPDGASRILEDDKISIWGQYLGVTSYQTVLGATVTLPSALALYIEIK